MDLTIVNLVILLILSVLSSVIFAQLFKTLLNSIIKGKVDLKTLTSDGDFPSAHTSNLVSFNIVFWNSVYAYYKLHTNYDPLPAILAGLILCLWSFYEIRDAMGVRLRVQEQAHAIKELERNQKIITEKLDEENEEAIISKAIQDTFNEVLSKVRLKAGHLPHEVIGGIVTGTFIGSIYTTYIYGYSVLRSIISVVFLVYILIIVAFFAIKKRK
jgi:acid phosphatase family membrane protein YuiD